MSEMSRGLHSPKGPTPSCAKPNSVRGNGRGWGSRGRFITVAPAPIFYEVIDGGATETDVLEGARVHETTLRHLYAYLGDDANEIETKNQLLWRHYVDAIFFASAGAREPARESVRRALAIQPDAAQLRLLDQVLSQPGAGPIDVRQFLVGSSYEE